MSRSPSIFEETADQEKEHAKRLFKFLEGGDLEVAAAFPAGVIGTTLDNLKASAAGEHHEQAEMYPGFAKTARKDGFPNLPKSSRPLRLPKNSTKNVTWRSPPTSRPGGCSNGKNRWFGAAATAATCTGFGGAGELPGLRPSSGPFRAVGRKLLMVDRDL